jgi:hypothetical protein
MAPKLIAFLLVPLLAGCTEGVCVRDGHCGKIGSHAKCSSDDGQWLEYEGDLTQDSINTACKKAGYTSCAGGGCSRPDSVVPPPEVDKPTP